MTRSRFRLIFAVFAIGFIGFLVAVRLSDPPPMMALREAYFDQLQQFRPREPVDLPVRVIDIDEASLARLGQWPWPRHMLASLNERLAELGVAVVVYDVIFAEPDRLSVSRLLDDPMVAGLFLGMGQVPAIENLDFDHLFAQSMDRLPVVLGVSHAGGTGHAPRDGKAGFVQIGGGPGNIPALPTVTDIVPVLYEAAAGTGSINVSPSGSGGVVRQVPLIWKTETGFLPSLATEALRVALQESTFVLQSDLSDTGLSEVRIGAYDVPTNEEGQFRVHYRPDDPDLYVPAFKVLDRDYDPEIRERLEGNIVFVGTSAAGLLDIRRTALSESIPGVSIHAQIVEQILLEHYLTRSTVQDIIEIVLFAATSVLVVLALAMFGPTTSVVLGGFAGLATLALSWQLYSANGILLDATFPVFGGFLVFTALTAFQFIVIDREKRLIRLSFSKYVSPTILSEIERKGHDLKLGGDMRDVLVMFSDIRDFTPLSESISAENLVALLNDLFTELTDEILEERGTIDKYIGDSVMAFWNAPVTVEGYHTRACIAALRMRAKLTVFSDKLERAGLPHIRMATGLASGTACVGNMGSRDRYNYSVIGAVVNEAARIESACREVGYDIVTTRSVAENAGGIALLEAGNLVLKGVSQRTTAYLVVGDSKMAKSDSFRNLHDAHAGLLAALRHGTDISPLLGECRDRCVDVEPNLLEFYDRIEARRSSFATGSSAPINHA
jgi:adenylate cyclase